MKPIKEAHDALRKQFTAFIAEARLHNAWSHQYINEGRAYRHRARATTPPDAALMASGWEAHAKGMAYRMHGERALSLALAFLNNTLYEDAERQRRSNLQAWSRAPIWRLLQPCFPSMDRMKLAACIETWTRQPLRPRDCAPPAEVAVATEAVAVS